MRDTDFIQPDFAYEAPQAAAGLAVALSIYADRSHLRASLSEDAAAAGLTVRVAGPLADLLEGAVRPLGDVVLVDCPQVDARTIAALCELDVRAARCDARLIVSTSVDALDAVFACMDQSAPVLLVDPNRAERVIALGQVLAGFPSARLRELSDDDRLMLLRLSEQVGQIAGRIERLAPGSGAGSESAADARGNAFGFKDRAVDRPVSLRAGDTARGALPDPALVRRIIRQRQWRARFLDGDLFADPAWDMLLDLTAAMSERKRVSVTSLCIASGVPPTTALRWIGQLVEAGLFTRVCDDNDRRRAFIELSDKAADAMARYFAEISLTVPVPV